jgi:GNAT superfamily N-acetyltransferase
MINELPDTQFERARSLFCGFDYSLSIQAAFEGNSPCRIFVDDLVRPQTALALTVEGYLLAGETGNLETNLALQRFFKDRIFTGQVFINGDVSMSLAVHPETWEAKLPELIPTHEVEKLDRYFYICRNLRRHWRHEIPTGYAILRLDQSILHEAGVNFNHRVREWMDIQQVWGTEQNFLAKGISYVAIYNQEVVAWCTPDCAAGERMDVGVFTHPAHRRKGLASAVVAATVEDCFSKGYTAVGWHCNAENVASWKTAEKVGFKRTREYAYYYYMYDLVDHLAELGWYNYRRGEYAQCVQYFEQVFTLRKENPDYYYHLAASAWALIGNGAQALAYLGAAAEHGWSDTAYTRGQEEFSIIRDTRAWRLVLARMEAN